MLEVPLYERAQYLTRVYGDIVADLDQLLKIIDQLKRFHGATRIIEWQTLAKEGAFETLATGLMEYHYDPRYIKQNATGKAQTRRYSCL